MTATQRSGNDRRVRLLARGVCVTAFVLALAFGVVACGDDDDAGSGGASGGGDTLTIVQAPDPIWNWMKEKGIIDQMSKEWGITPKVTETFDWFPLFAGGHADVTQAGTYELPDLDGKGIPSVTFGRYNKAKDFWVVPPDSNAKTLEDLPDGAKIGAFSNGATTALWAAMLKPQLDGADFRTDDRWQLVVADTEQLPGLVMKGELDAAIVDPQLAATLLASGELKPMYDGKTVAQMFADTTGGPPIIETNLLVAKKDWYAKPENKRKARFYLALWDRGLQEWKNNREAIIQKFPDDFSIKKDSDVKAFTGFLDNNFNWFDETAILDKEFIDSQPAVFDLMKESGALDPNFETPAFDALQPGSPDAK